MIEASGGAITTDERIFSLWHEGYSAREIGAKVGLSTGTIDGKIFRAGLRRRDSHNSTSQKLNGLLGSIAQRAVNGRDMTMQRRISLSALEAGRRLAQQPFPPVTGAVAGSEPVAFLERQPLQCVWIIDGDGADATCCGGKRERGPYCAEHGRIAYTPDSNEGEGE